MKEKKENRWMRLCLCECASANRRDGSRARNLFPGHPTWRVLVWWKVVPTEWTHTRRTRQPWQRWLGLTWKLLSNSGAATQWCCPPLRVQRHERIHAGEIHARQGVRMRVCPFKTSLLMSGDAGRGASCVGIGRAPAGTHNLQRTRYTSIR